MGLEATKSKLFDGEFNIVRDFSIRNCPFLKLFQEYLLQLEISEVSLKKEISCFLSSAGLDFMGS